MKIDPKLSQLRIKSFSPLSQGNALDIHIVIESCQRQGRSMADNSVSQSAQFRIIYFGVRYFLVLFVRQYYLCSFRDHFNYNFPRNLNKKAKSFQLFFDAICRFN